MCFPFLAALAVCLCLGVETARAETITYTGNSSELKTGTIGGSNNTPGSVFSTLTPSGNTITVNYTSGGTNTNPYRVFGGLSGTAAVTGNTVNFLNGTVTNNLYGGYDAAASGFGAAQNRVVISGGTINELALGGYSNSGNAEGNSVTMSAGVAKNITGGESTNGAAINNTVNISGNTVIENVIGGMVVDGTATGNTVNISGITRIQNVIGGMVVDGTATGNTVNISGGTVSGTVYGGKASAASGDIFTNNTLNMTAAPTTIQAVQNFQTINFTYAGNANIGTLTTTTGQDVTINTDAHAVTFDGTVTGAGAITKTGAGTLTLSGTNTYSGMTTVMSGGLVAASTLGSSSGLTLYGGSSFTSFAGDTWNGKNLTVNGQGASYTGNLTATGAGTVLNFIAPLHSTGPLLSVTGTTTIDDSTVNVGIANNARLPANTTITLIDSTGVLTATNLSTGSGTAGGGIVGLSQVYTYTVAADGNKLIANMESTQSDPGVQKSPAEGKAAAVALVTQGADLAAGQGMFNARAATRATGAARTAGGAGGMGVAGFGAMSGGTSRYNSGSHVDVDSISFMTGLAKTWQAPGGAPVDILGGVFFEAGWGSYNSYNGLEDGNTFKGKGNSRYMGGGLLGRVDVTESSLKGLYAEASFRVGGLHNDYRSGIVPGSTNGERASYDTSATYYGAHTGLGYIWELSERANLDLYGKYFWTHTTGSNVTILGDKVEFDAVNSHRTRLGTRFSYAVNEYITPYVGVAWDYEFDGKARSVIMGENAPAPSLKGSTGMGELGLTWKPAAASAFSIDAGVQGYTGKREGVSGNVQLKFEF